MIELLIVIAVLGILAVAVLAAINPIEQINRSKDTGTRSDSEQLIGGIDRFYTQKGYYPWQDSPNDEQSALANWLNVRNKDGDATVNKILTNLAGSTGELKESFTSRVTKNDYNPLFLYNQGGQGDSTYVCFSPSSKAFEADGWKRCGEDISGSGLPDDVNATGKGNICGGGSGNAYSCLP